MTTDNAKRGWVKVYIVIKIVEVFLAGFLYVGDWVLYAAEINTKAFSPFIKGLVYLGFLWEIIYCLYRIVFLYSGVRFRIPMSILSIVAFPGWYVLFAGLTDVHVMLMERLVAHLWFLPALTPLMVVLSFCFDINIKSKIEEKIVKTNDL